MIYDQYWRDLHGVVHRASREHGIEGPYAQCNLRVTLMKPDAIWFATCLWCVQWR